MNTITPNRLKDMTATFFNDESGEWESVEVSKVKELMEEGVECQLEGGLEFDVNNNGNEELWTTPIRIEVNEGQIFYDEESFYEDLELEFDGDTNVETQWEVAEMYRKLLGIE